MQKCFHTFQHEHTVYDSTVCSNAAICGLEWEIALTYISSVSRRSVASVSPHFCSHRHGDGCCGGGHWQCWRLGSSVSLWISWQQSVCMICEELSLLISSEAPEAHDLSALSGSPCHSCRECAAGGWKVLWSSLSGLRCGTRVSGSSPRSAFGSDLTRGKTVSLTLHQWHHMGTQKKQKLLLINSFILTSTFLKMSNT